MLKDLPDRVVFDPVEVGGDLQFDSILEQQVDDPQIGESGQYSANEAAIIDTGISTVSATFLVIWNLFFSA